MTLLSTISDLEFAILPVGLLVGAGILVYFAVINLKQGFLLRKPLTLDRLKDHLGRLVVVHGEPEPLEEVKGPGRRPVLWFSSERQQYVRYGRSSGHWRKVRERVKRTDFHLHFPDGGRVRVRCRPTEVQTARSRTSGGAGVLRLSGAERTVQRWLPVPPALTVMGKVVLEEEGATVVPHPKQGLFFSEAPPERAARTETTKGWACAAGAALCVVLAAVIAAGLAT